MTTTEKIYRETDIHEANDVGADGPLTDAEELQKESMESALFRPVSMPKPHRDRFKELKVGTAEENQADRDFLFPDEDLSPEVDSGVDTLSASIRGGAFSARESRAKEAEPTKRATSDEDLGQVARPEKFSNNDYPMDDDIAAYIRKRDAKRAANRERQRPRRPPKLALHKGNMLGKVPTPAAGVLGDLLAPDTTVILAAAGSKSLSFVLGLAESLVAGSDFVGQTCTAKRVLYIDAVRPLEVISRNLRSDRTSLSNLYVMARDDFDPQGSVLEQASKELAKLPSYGLLPSLIVVNPLDRLALMKDRKNGGTLYLPARALDIFSKYPDIPKVVVVPVARAKISGLESLRGKMPDLIDGASSVLVLQEAGERHRLTHYLYGEVVSDIAVDPANWRRLGNFDAAGKDSVRAKVLSLLIEVGDQGLTPIEAAAALSIDRNNVYQALFQLKKGEATMHSGRYYLRGKEPEEPVGRGEMRKK